MEQHLGVLISVGVPRPNAAIDERMNEQESALWLKHTGGSSTLDMLKRPTEDWSKLQDSLRHEMTRLVLHEEDKLRQRQEMLEQHPFYQLGERPRKSRHLVHSGTPVERKLKGGRMLRLTGTQEFEDMISYPDLIKAESSATNQKSTASLVGEQVCSSAQPTSQSHCEPLRVRTSQNESRSPLASTGQEAIKNRCHSTNSTSFLSYGSNESKNQQSIAVASAVADEDPVMAHLKQRQEQLQSQLLHVTRKLCRKYTKNLFPKPSASSSSSSQMKYLAQQWQKAQQDPSNATGKALTDSEKYKLYMDARYVTQCQMDFHEQPLEPKEGAYGHHRHHSVHTKYGDALVKCRRGLRGNF